MGNVICTYEILPDSPEAFDKLKESLAQFNPENIEEEPIAFGLKKLIMKVVIPEEDGALDNFENKLNDLEGVGGVELKHFTRAI